MKEDRKNYLFLQYFECSPPLEVVYRILGCVCLRWFTGYEVDHTIEDTPPMNSKRGVEVGWLFEVIYFESVTDSVILSLYLVKSLEFNI